MRVAGSLSGKGSLFMMEGELAILQGLGMWECPEVL